MALALELVRGGFSPGQARAAQGQVSSAVSAAGTLSTDATAISAGHNVVTTVASGSGVILPACEVGDEIFVHNATATNTLSVYPDSGSTINQLAANIAGNLPPYRGALFKRATSTSWVAFMSG